MSGPLSWLRVAIRLPLFLVANLLFASLYWLARRMRPAACRPVQVLWCRAMCGLSGLTIRTLGAPHAEGATLFVSNHVSYLDIAILSRTIKGTFIAKSEVARWPLFGMISTLTGTIYVERRRSRAAQDQDAASSRLAAGEDLILFPEGTSSDGSSVLPFKSALFEVAVRFARAGGAVSVQPVSIAYTRDRAGQPLTGPRAALYGWYGDMSLIPHLLRVLSLPGAEVEVRIHSPLRVDGGADRKAIARRCREAVLEGVLAAHRTALPAATEGDRTRAAE